ncbi:MAG: coenzyme F420-0:L-glutamate ligase, partial [Firmicutes bacterium]|nr:coenzyme F420-0:L-glutamate ligase [Bacillota bacterium]
MERCIGTISRGVRAPIIKTGDDIVKIVTESILKASVEEGIEVKDRDVIAVTESVVARAQGNYATTEQLAADVKAKIPSGEFGVIMPILSRNRFAIVLRGMAMAAKKIYLMLSYPSDEVGNHLISEDAMDDAGVDPYRDILTESRWRELFGYEKHRFTGVDYIEYYKEIITNAGAEAVILFANDPRAILDYTKNVITCDIHTRERSKKLLRKAGAEIVLGMDDILNASVNGSGYNEKYGLLGTNKATEDSVKLFPRDGQPVVDGIAETILKATGKHVEVMIYGDGAFKDPVGKIWELADPVVSPFHTAGLAGQPNELKLKFLADNYFADLKGEDLKKAIEDAIKTKDANLVGNMASEGT